MKKRTGKTVLAVLLILIGIAALSRLRAGAEGFFTPVNGGEFSFDETVTQRADASLAELSIDYTLSPGSESAAEEGKLAIYSGEDDARIFGVPEIVNPQLRFGEEDEADAVYLEDGTKSVTKAVRLDFSGVEFSKPGIYRWILHEECSVSSLSGDDLVLDVYIFSDEETEGVLYVGGYVLHQSLSAPDYDSTPGEESASQEAKVDGHLHMLEHEKLTVCKTVDGTHGSPEKYFAVTVKAQVEDGVICKVDMSEAESAPQENEVTAYSEETMAEGNSIERLSAEELAEGHTFYLRHGQSVTIEGLKKGTSYEVTEEEEEYDSTVPDNAAGEINDDIKLTFVNTLELKKMTVSKTVKGTHASKEKYFAITVKAQLESGTVCKVDMSKAESAPQANEATRYSEETMADGNSVETLSAEELAKGHTFYLRHGQSVTIDGLKKGTAYEITEEKEDYDSTAPDNAAGEINDDIKVAFVNTLELKKMTVSKTVKGTHASKEKYFAITVKAQLESGTVCKVDMSKAESAPQANEATRYSEETMADGNSVETLSAEELAKGHTFYLRHGQSVTIDGLKKGTAYEITEEKEDYDSTAPDNAAGEINDDIKVAFVNKKVDPEMPETGDAGAGMLWLCVMTEALAFLGLSTVFILRSRTKEDKQR